MIIKEDRDCNLVPTMRASFRMKIAEIARLTCSEWELYPGGHENIDFASNSEFQFVLDFLSLREAPKDSLNYGEKN